MMNLKNQFLSLKMRCLERNLKEMNCRQFKRKIKIYNMNCIKMKIKNLNRLLTNFKTNMKNKN